MKKPSLESAARLLRDAQKPKPTATTPTQHARLPTEHLAKAGFGKSANAAKAVADLGGSPRQQIDAARAYADGKRLNYLPHQGAKEIAKRKAKMERLEQRKRSQRMRHGDLVAAYTLTDEQAEGSLSDLVQAAEYGVLAPHTIRAQ